MSDEDVPLQANETAAHRLDYGHLAYQIHEAPKKEITLDVPAAFLCMMWQVLWGAVVGLVLSFLRMGRAKSLLIDTGVYLLPGLPSILALVFFVRGWRLKKPKRFSVLTLVATVAALAFLFYLFRWWYADIWRDPGGYWDSM